MAAEHEAAVAVVIERLDTIEETIGKIHEQTLRTNGRVSELEVKERIRQDREEQRAIVSAAQEAAKYRVEQANERQALVSAEESRTRITWRITLIAAAIGGLPAALIEAAHVIFG